jgi:hypothetical protein
MRSRSRRIAAAIALLAGGGWLLTGPNTGCGSFLLQSAVSAADFCFIFDCQNGILGGTFDPCAGENPLLADCPEQGP